MCNWIVCVTQKSAQCCLKWALEVGEAMAEVGRGVGDVTAPSLKRSGRVYISPGEYRWSLAREG